MLHMLKLHWGAFAYSNIKDMIMIQTSAKGIAYGYDATRGRLWNIESTGSAAGPVLAVDFRRSPW